MIKVEAVVIRERVETVIDAVEDATGHVGVTVIEAIGHGRQRGVTHEYRGRVFESRFLPKALLIFVVEDDARRRGRGGDRRRGAERQRVGRRDRLDDARRQRHAQPDGPEPGGGGSSHEHARSSPFAASTIWVVIAAVLVMFMQAGFAFLEAGLTRMKNVGHIAAKNVLILAIASIVYYLVGFGIAFGDGGNGFVGGSGFVPVGRRAARDRRGAVLVVRGDPRARPATCSRSSSARVSLAIVWGAMAERTKLWVYFAFGVVFTLDLLARLALDLEPRRLALRQGDAGLRRLDRRALPGRARGARGSAPARAAHRQVRRGREAERDPGPQHGLHDARRDHPLVRLVRLQPGLDAQRRLRRRRLLRLRRAEHEHRGGGRRARRRRSRRGS